MIRPDTDNERYPTYDQGRYTLYYENYMTGRWIRLHSFFNLERASLVMNALSWERFNTPQWLIFDSVLTDHALYNAGNEGALRLDTYRAPLFDSPRPM